jgi:hypothetical protein
MADETHSASFTATEDPITRANYGGASQQPESARPAGPAGAQAPKGGGFPMPVPGLPFGIEPKKALWWGGLAALAAVEVIEWPVAVVVGVGSWVAERWAREDARRAGNQPS